MKRTLRGTSVLFVVVLAMVSLIVNATDIAIPQDRTATLKFTVSRVSSNTCLSNPGLFLSDGDPDTSWKARVDEKDIWAEAVLANPSAIEGIRVNKSSGSSLEVYYASGDEWLKAPTSSLCGLRGWQILDLSPLQIVSERLRLKVIPGAGETETGLSEVEIIGGEPCSASSLLIPLNIRVSENAEAGHPTTDLFDGNTRTCWRTKGSETGWVETELPYQSTITDIRFFLTASSSDAYRFSYQQDGQWNTSSELVDAGNRAFVQGWNEIHLLNPIGASRFRLEVVKSGSAGQGSIAELEFWGNTTEGNSPVRSWYASSLLPATPNMLIWTPGPMERQGRLTMFLSGPVKAHTWLNSYDLGELASSRDLEKVDLPHDIVLQGMNDLKWETSRGGCEALVREWPDNGLLTGINSDPEALCDGSTFRSVAIGAEAVKISMRKPADLNHVRVYVSKPGQYSISLELWNGQNAVSPAIHPISLSAPKAGWYAVSLTGIADQIRLKSDTGIYIAEVQCFGSPVTTGAPQIRLSSPLPDTMVSGSFSVTGTVDEPDASVTVNGKHVSLDNGSFSATVEPNKSRYEQIVVVEATDAEGRKTTKEIAVRLTDGDPGLSLDQKWSELKTEETAVDISGAIASDAYEVLIGGERAPLQGKSFSRKVPLVMGVNRVEVEARFTDGIIIKKSLTILRDLSAPVIQVFAPFKGEVSPRTTVTVVGSVQDLLPTQVWVNGTAVELSGNLFRAKVSLQPGANTIRVSAKDSLGHETSLDVPIKVSLGAPEISLTSPVDEQLLQKDEPIAVKGTVISEDLTSLIINVRPVQVDQRGRFELKGVQLQEGVNLFTVVAEDAAGHQTTREIRAVLDTQEPVSFTPVVAQGRWTNQTTASVFFETVDKGSGIDYYEAQLDNGQWVRAASPTVFENLSEGNHTVCVRAFDKAGRFAEGTAEFGVDLGAPVLQDVTAPTKWESKPISVVFTASDALSGVERYQISVDNGEFHEAKSPCVMSELSDGKHLICVAAVDRAGNRAEKTIEVLSDRTAPADFEIAGLPEGWTNGKSVITFETTDPASGIARYELRVDNDKWQNVTSPLALDGLSDGRHKISVKAVNQAGLETVAAADCNVDTAAPEEFTVDAPEWTSNVEPTISFKAKDRLSGVDHYEIAIDGGSFAEAKSPYKCAALTEGTHSIKAKAIDKAGNEFLKQISLGVDLTPPETPQDFRAVPGHNKALITWTGGQADVAVYKIHRVTGVGVRVLTVPGESHQYFDYDVRNKGNYSYAIEAVDRAGNVSKLSSEQGVTPGGFLFFQTGKSRTGVSTRSFTPDGTNYVYESAEVKVVIPGGATDQVTAQGVQDKYGVQYVELNATDGTAAEYDPGVSFLEHVLIGEKLDSDPTTLVPCSFKEPIAVSLRYDKNNVPAGYSELDLVPYRYNSDSRTWERIDGDVNLYTGEVTTMTAQTAGGGYQLKADLYEAPMAEEFEKMGVSPYADYFGNNTENVSPETGALSLNVTDVSLPGVNGFDMALRRRYNSALAYAQFRDMKLHGASSEERTKLKSWRRMGLGWELDVPWVEKIGDGTRIHFSGGIGCDLGNAVAGSIVQGHAGLFKIPYNKSIKYVHYGEDELDKTFWTHSYLTDPEKMDSPRVYEVETREGYKYRFIEDRLVMMQDKNGNTVRYKYDASGRLVEIADIGKLDPTPAQSLVDNAAALRSIRLSYYASKLNGCDRLEWVTWTGSNRGVDNVALNVHYFYDTNGELYKVVDPEGAAALPGQEPPEHTTVYDYILESEGTASVNDNTEKTVTYREWHPRNEELDVPTLGETSYTVQKQRFVNGIKLLREIKYPSSGKTKFTYNCDQYTDILSSTHTQPSPYYGARYTDTVILDTSYNRTWIAVATKEEYRRGETTPASTTNYGLTVAAHTPWPQTSRNR